MAHVVKQRVPFTAEAPALDDPAIKRAGDAAPADAFARVFHQPARGAFTTERQRSLLAPVLLLTAGLAAGYAGAMWSRQAGVAPAATQAAPVSPLPVAAAPVPAGIQAKGFVVAERTATVSANVTGRIAALHVAEGQNVTRGALLATLDQRSARYDLSVSEARRQVAIARLAEAEADATQAGLDLTRVQSLTSSGAVSMAQLDKARTTAMARAAARDAARQEVALADANLSVARYRLDETELRAPFDGVVSAINAQPGEVVSPSSAGGFTRTGVCTLIDTGSLAVDADLPEALLADLRPGVRAMVRPDALPGVSVAGEVLRIAPAVDRQRASITVRIAIPADAAAAAGLLPNMTVSVELDRGNRT